MAEKHVRELKPGEDDQSVYEIYYMMNIYETQNGNSGGEEILRGALYRRRSTSVVWRRA